MSAIALIKEQTDLWLSLEDCLFEIFDDMPGSSIKPGTKFISVMRFSLDIKGQMTFSDVINIQNRIAERLQLFVDINSLKGIKNFKQSGYQSCNDVIQQFSFDINIKIK